MINDSQQNMANLHCGLQCHYYYYYCLPWCLYAFDRTICGNMYIESSYDLIVIDLERLIMISLVGDQPVTCVSNADCVKQHGAAQYDSLQIEASLPFPS